MRLVRLARRRRRRLVLILARRQPALCAFPFLGDIGIRGEARIADVPCAAVEAHPHAGGCLPALGLAHRSGPDSTPSDRIRTRHVSLPFSTVRLYGPPSTACPLRSPYLLMGSTREHQPQSHDACHPEDRKSV